MQKFLIFDENKNSMEKEIKTATEKIKELNELGNTLTLHQKLHRAKLTIGKVVKNSTAKIPTKNGTMNLVYADLNAIMDIVEPVLLENGLILLQPIQGNSVCTQIVDIDSGAMLQSCMDLPQNVNPQQMGSAISYYRRYTLQSALSLQAVDDDGQQASKEQPTETKKESLSDARFKAALAKIASNEFTVEELKAKFYLTKEQEAQL
jgi:hypothetical protein